MLNNYRGGIILNTNASRNQGIGDFVGEVNQLRANELLLNLNKQDINLEKALNELQKVRDIVNNPQHIQGSINSKHGIIAEHVEICFNNADNMVVGKLPDYIKEPNLASPIDYHKSGNPIQAKFVQKNLGMDAISDHLKEYPDFLSNGGSYDIPQDYFEKIKEWRKLTPVELKNLPKADGGDVARSVVKKIEEFEKNNSVKFEDVVQPTQASYDEVQLGKVDNTIDNKEKEIVEVDGVKREEHQIKARASVKEGLKVAGIAAAIDGVLSFGITVISKFNQGKKLSTFTENDWKDIFKETGVGVARGGITGGSIYTLTNVAGMSAPVAAGIVTATFGLAKQAIQLGEGKISTDDFIYNVQQIATDTAVSGVGAVVGQMLIPVPVIGAIVGSVVATKVLSIIRDDLWGGDYYGLVDKAKHENELTSVYTLLTESLLRSQESFENMVQTYVSQSQQYRKIQYQDTIETNKLDDLFKRIR